MRATLARILKYGTALGVGAYLLLMMPVMKHELSQRSARHAYYPPTPVVVARPKLKSLPRVDHVTEPVAAFSTPAREECELTIQASREAEAMSAGHRVVLRPPSTLSIACTSPRAERTEEPQEIEAEPKKLNPLR